MWNSFYDSNKLPKYIFIINKYKSFIKKKKQSENVYLKFEHFGINSIDKEKISIETFGFLINVFKFFFLQKIVFIYTQ